MNHQSPASRAVVTSHPLAAAAAHSLLDRGATAVEAAVAGAAVLTVVDPRSTSIAGDLFAMVWPAGASEPVGLTAAGPAPAGMGFDALVAAGHSRMPSDGPWSVTVPGAPAGWRVLLERFGSTPLEHVLEPAIRAAHDGAAVLPAIAREWASTVAKLERNPAAAELFLPGGRPPAVGEVLANPEYGRFLEELAARGLRHFYSRGVAERLAAEVAALGGPLAADDIAGWDDVEWVAPLSVDAGGARLHELPPPGQGLVALLGEAIYQRLRTGDPLADAHLAAEALRAAFRDGHESIADPRVVDVPVGRLLDPARLDEIAAEISPDRASASRVGAASNTVYIAVVDEHGGACSLIQSLFDGFGSGIVVPGLGIPLQNRASSFDLIAGHPNAPAPGKRPYHTIIPAMLSREGAFAGALGVVGGYMQPQGHVQVLRNALELGMSAQEAVDAPRFRLYSGLRLGIEEGFDAATADALRERGHELETLETFEAGGAQLLLRTASGYETGSDRRKDGLAHA